jgi:hypothetical protein
MGRRVYSGTMESDPFPRSSATGGLALPALKIGVFTAPETDASHFLS